MNGPNVVVLSDAIWRTRFGADRGIVGREIKLNDSNYLVIGVMPKSFENVMAPQAQMWTPLQYDVSEGRAWGHHLHTIGRLRAGVSLEQASSELDVLAHQILNEQRPETYGSGDQLVMKAVPLQEDLTR